jgi:hypothetical protein
MGRDIEMVGKDRGAYMGKTIDRGKHYGHSRRNAKYPENTRDNALKHSRRNSLQT